MEYENECEETSNVWLRLMHTALRFPRYSQSKKDLMHHAMCNKKQSTECPNAIDSRSSVSTFPLPIYNGSCVFVIPMYCWPPRCITSTFKAHFEARINYGTMQVCMWRFCVYEARKHVWKSALYFFHCLFGARFLCNPQETQKMCFSILNFFFLHCFMF